MSLPESMVEKAARAYAESMNLYVELRLEVTTDEAREVLALLDKMRRKRP